MKPVNIARFKAELGKYMKAVRKGEEVTVLDRQHPVAKLVPFDNAGVPTTVTRPSRGRIGDLIQLLEKGYTPVPGIDSLQLLLEDRRKR